jgi:hypothetical protein
MDRHREATAKVVNPWPDRKSPGNAVVELKCGHP